MYLLMLMTHLSNDPGFKGGGIFLGVFRLIVFRNVCRKLNTFEFCFNRAVLDDYFKPQKRAVCQARAF